MQTMGLFLNQRTSMARAAIEYGSQRWPSKASILNSQERFWGGFYLSRQTCRLAAGYRSCHVAGAWGGLTPRADPWHPFPMGEWRKGTPRSARDWAPFSAVEIEVFLAAIAFVVGTASLAGIDSNVLAGFSAGMLVVGYLAGLLVYARRQATPVQFIEAGALRGAGYFDSFRRAKRSLLLMHLDDDPPSDELLGLYRSLLDRGVQIRRIVFLREAVSAHGYEWICRFGTHDNLLQRAVPAELSTVIRSGFAVVDSSEVLLALPGYEPIERRPYTESLVLRHLLAVRDERLAEVFARVHEEVWERASDLVVHHAPSGTTSA